MGSSLSNCLDMAVTMKSAVRVDMNSASLELADFPDEIILKMFASLNVKDLKAKHQKDLEESPMMNFYGKE